MQRITPPLTPTTKLYEELQRAYNTGFREYQVFKEYGTGKKCILCLWCPGGFYGEIKSKFPGFDYWSVYYGVDVLCFSWYEYAKGGFVPYQPQKVLTRAP